MAPTQTSGSQILNHSILAVDQVQMAANTIKGNNTGTPADEMDLSVAQVQALLNIGGGSVTGAGASTQLAYWTSASNLAGDAGITYNAATDTLSIAGDLNVVGNITSNNTVIASTSVAGNVALIGAISTDNTNATSGAITQILVGGANAGDPNVQLVVTGVTTWTIGIDNSDSDKLKIGTSAAIGTNTMLTVDTTGLATFVNDVTVTAADPAGNIYLSVANTDNTDVASHASLRVSTGGASSGDPYITLTVASATDWAIGVDNSDSDKLKIGTGTAIGTNTRMSIATAGGVVLSQTLDVGLGLSVGPGAVAVTTAAISVGATAANSIISWGSSGTRKMLIEYSNANERLQFYSDIAGGYLWYMEGGVSGAVGTLAFYPAVDNSRDIGATAFRWRDYFGYNVTLSGLGQFNSTVNVGALSAPTLAGSVKIGQTATTTTVDSVLNLIYGSHTALTASTEWIPYKFGMATATWAAGTLATQRYINVSTPTIAFATASTATTAVTFHVSGAPSAGSNATITNPIGVQVSSSSMSYPSAAGLAIRAVDIRADTIVISGTTTMTATPSFAGIRVNQVTLSAAGALTANDVASVYIADAPLAGGANPITLTRTMALWVDAGWTRLDDGLSVGTTTDPGAGNVSVSGNLSAGTLNSVGVLTADSGASLTMSDALTVTSANIMSLYHESSATPGVGFGMVIRQYLESATVPTRDAMYQVTTWATATDASRKARAVWNIYDTAAREAIRIEASGTAAMIGFLGAAAVVRQTVAAAAPAGGTGTAAGGYDTAANRNSMITLLNNIRTAGINLGLWA